MNMPLITDEKDPKWVLLGKILGIVSSRRVKQEMAKRGISPMGVSELLKREELRRFAKLVEIPEAKDIYRFLSIIVDSVKGMVTGDYLVVGEGGYIDLLVGFEESDIFKLIEFKGYLSEVL